MISPTDNKAQDWVQPVRQRFPRLLLSGWRWPVPRSVSESPWPPWRNARYWSLLTHQTSVPPTRAGRGQQQPPGCGGEGEDDDDVQGGGGAAPHAPRSPSALAASVSRAPRSLQSRPLQSRPAGCHGENLQHWRSLAPDHLAPLPRRGLAGLAADLVSQVPRGQLGQVGQVLPVRGPGLATLRVTLEVLYPEWRWSWEVALAPELSSDPDLASSLSPASKLQMITLKLSRPLGGPPQLVKTFSHSH